MTIVKELRNTNPFAEPESAARVMERAALKIEELERKLSEEQGHSMMAGSQNSALRLQLKDAEERATKAACGR